MGATTMALITDVRNWVLCFVKLPCRFLLQKNRETSWSSWITFLLPDSFFISSFFLVRKILGSEGIISLNYQLRTRYVFLCVCVCVWVCVSFSLLRLRGWQQFRQVSDQKLLVFLSVWWASWPTILSSHQQKCPHPLRVRVSAIVFASRSSNRRSFKGYQRLLQTSIEDLSENDSFVFGERDRFTRNHMQIYRW